MTDHDDVQALLTRYKESAYQKDIDAFMSIYSEGVRIFDLWGAWQSVGASAWREGITGWFDSLGDGRVVVDFSEVEISVDGALAAVSAMVEYSGESSTGVIEREMANRLTWVLGRIDGDWLVAHEHTSAPVDMQSGKVILSR